MVFSRMVRAVSATVMPRTVDPLIRITDIVCFGPTDFRRLWGGSLDAWACSACFRGSLLETRHCGGATSLDASGPSTSTSSTLLLEAAVFVRLCEFLRRCGSRLDSGESSSNSPEAIICVATPFLPALAYSGAAWALGVLKSATFGGLLRLKRLVVGAITARSSKGLVIGDAILCSPTAFFCDGVVVVSLDDSTAMIRPCVSDSVFELGAGCTIDDNSSKSSSPTCCAAKS